MDHCQTVTVALIILGSVNTLFILKRLCGGPGSPPRFRGQCLPASPPPAGAPPAPRPK